jgi:hypothetical protein
MEAAAGRSLWQRALDRWAPALKPAVAAALLLLVPALVYYPYQPPQTVGEPAEPAAGPARQAEAGGAARGPRTRGMAPAAAAAGDTIEPGVMIVLNNLEPGRWSAPIYGPERDNGSVTKQGNPPEGLPAGSMVYTGALLAGSNYTCQAWAAPGAGRSEEVLEPGPTTTFRTGKAAGYLNPLKARLGGVAPDEGAATVQLRVWDNQGGAVSNWWQAVAQKAARGVSKPVTVNLARGEESGAFLLEGLESFNIAY